MVFRDGEGVCTKLRLCMYLLTLRLNKRPYFTGYVYPFSKCRYQTVVATMYALRLSEYSCIYVNADVEEQAFGTVTVSSWRGLVKWAWLSSVGLVVASISKPRKPGRMGFFATIEDVAWCDLGSHIANCGYTGPYIQDSDMADGLLF